MENALLIGLSRQVALARELDVIANNVANIGTNGFKARSAARSRNTSCRRPARDAFPRPDQRLSYVHRQGHRLDCRSGPIERTGNPLDVADQRRRLLAVQTPKGERYTRNGALQINAPGRAGHQRRLPGARRRRPDHVQPAAKRHRIGADGTSPPSQGEKGKLKLVRFADPRRCATKAPTSSRPTAPPRRRRRGRGSRPGAIERSNVKPVLEMSRLIEVNRAYATVAAMMQRNDDLRRSAIERLASVTN